MLTAVLDSATKVIVNTHRRKWAPHAGFYMASLRQSGIIWMQPLLKALWTNPRLLNYGKSTFGELAQTSPIRQLFAPFSAKGVLGYPDTG